MLRTANYRRCHHAVYKKMLSPLEVNARNLFLVAVTESGCEKQRYIAFKYIPRHDRAPICIEKGTGLNCNRALKIARREKAKVVQSTVFTEFLIQTVECDDEIPEGLYQLFVYLYFGDSLQEALTKVMNAAQN